jgi:hypothetical protein
MLCRIGVLISLAVATLVPSGPVRAQQFFSMRGDAQAHCPGGTVIRMKAPRGAIVLDSEGAGSPYGAYVCQQELTGAEAANPGNPVAANPFGQPSNNANNGTAQ